MVCWSLKARSTSPWHAFIVWQWAAERTNQPREVCELALAHVNSDRVEAAYQRSDLFDLRQRLMEQWSAYVSANDADVVRLHG